MKNIIDKLMSNQEAKSWEERIEVRFVILHSRMAVTEYGRHQEWFRLEKIEQSKIYPAGITKETALKLAGKTGRVWIKMVRTKRIK